MHSSDMLEMVAILLVGILAGMLGGMLGIGGGIVITRTAAKREKPPDGSFADLVSGQVAGDAKEEGGEPPLGNIAGGRAVKTDEGLLGEIRGVLAGAQAPVKKGHHPPFPALHQDAERVLVAARGSGYQRVVFAGIVHGRGE